MISLYLLAAVSGFAFMGISALMGHFGGHGDGGHAGHGGHGGHGHVGHGHAGTLGHHGESGLELPLLSPTAIAAYVTGFGSSGLIITEGLHVANPLIHVPLAMTFAGAFGVSVLFAMAKLSQAAEGNTLASLQDVVGTDVEVSIAIPPSGEGEVAYVDAGTRQTAMARSEAGQSFPQGARVRVTRAVDGTLFVTTAGSLAAKPVSVGEPVELAPQKEKVR